MLKDMYGNEIKESAEIVCGGFLICKEMNAFKCSDCWHKMNG